MNPEKLKPGVLILEDGAEFPGYLFGAPVTAGSLLAASSSAKSRDSAHEKSRIHDHGYGEVVFNTSMTGYQEILTDPSYFGQMICMTPPHIGNTGVNAEDPESDHPWCAGFIIHQNCDHSSNWRAKGELDAYLREHGIPGLLDVDTRALTLHLRSMGVVRGVILPEAEKDQAKNLLTLLPRFEGRDLIGEVSTRKPYYWTQRKTKPLYRVVAMDFGIKRNLLRNLEQVGCEIEVIPANTSADAILARKPDGVFLSNGPGDPSAAPYAAETVRQLVGKTPIFGVCMGHQILALAMGAKTYKLKFGHRGGNQPVLDKATGRVEISSHNHGYSVDAASMPAGLEVTHLSLNDRTVEGMEIKGANAFSVQYHPEACPGPHDSVALFGRFIDLMKNRATERSRLEH